MEFKDPLTPLEQIPIKYRGAFGRWRKIKQTPLADRLWRYVDKRGPDQCWPFIGKTLVRGYGYITLSAKPRVRVLSHRLAWIVTHGPIPDGLFICHHCDNPPCCNPKHLFAGTPQDNVTDCVQKGRWNAPRGERAGSAILTEAQVIQIRAMYKPGVISYAMIGKLFGVAKPTISGIMTRRKWKHI